MILRTEQIFSTNDTEQTLDTKSNCSAATKMDSNVTKSSAKPERQARIVTGLIISGTPKSLIGQRLPVAWSDHGYDQLLQDLIDKGLYPGTKSRSLGSDLYALAIVHRPHIKKPVQKLLYSYHSSEHELAECAKSAEQDLVWATDRWVAEGMPFGSRAAELRGEA